MSQVIEQQPVYVLNRRVYQESSLIVDIFSYHHGRLSLIAKGVLKGKKNWPALLQVFQPLLIDWSGRASLKNVLSVEAPSQALKLGSDRLFCAYYLNELILKLIPEAETNEEIFSFYVATLQSLSQGELIEPALRRFELLILTRLGFAPDFSVDSQGYAIDENQRYQFINLLGFVRTVNTGLSMFLGRDLIRVSHGGFIDISTILTEVDHDFLQSAKRLMRMLINAALDGKTLNSRKLFEQLKS